MYSLNELYNSLVPELSQAGTGCKCDRYWYPVDRVHYKSMYSGKLVPGVKLVIDWYVWYIGM